MRIVSDDSHWASTRAVCVVRLVHMADSRTERLRLQLTASNSRHFIAPMYLIQPSSPLQRNKRHPCLVAAASDQRNAVHNICFLHKISLR